MLLECYLKAINKEARGAHQIKRISGKKELEILFFPIAILDFICSLLFVFIVFILCRKNL